MEQGFLELLNPTVDQTLSAPYPSFESLLQELFTPEGGMQVDAAGDAAGGERLDLSDADIPEVMIYTEHELPEPGGVAVAVQGLTTQAGETGRPPTPSASSSSSSSSGGSAEPPGISLREKVDHMKTALGRYDKVVGANGANGKIQVHQVVLFLLLANVNSNIKVDLKGILVFCDSDGSAQARKQSRTHFTAKRTKEMGQIWQMVKENRNANYDTFARAMRVCREKQQKDGYFEYLESGKSSKKRVYKLGPKALQQMRKMEELLPQMCK